MDFSEVSNLRQIYGAIPHLPHFICIGCFEIYHKVHNGFS